jgi:polysaccharide deacetylase 2 family uncharacterized protein YibQ
MARGGRTRRPSVGWPLRLAWALLLTAVAAFAFLMAAPPAWLARLGLERPASTVVVGHLPALPSGIDPLSGATPAWQQHRAAPVPAPADRPLIAIVLTGLGRDEGLTRAAIDLPPTFSLSFSPYARPFGATIEAARAAGHELLVDLPMEGSASDAGAGPRILLTLLTASRNLERLEAILGEGNPWAGVAVIGGERFLAAPDLAQPVLDRLARVGLMVVAPQIEPAPSGRAVLLVDSRLADLDSLERALAELERRALIAGSAVATLPATDEALARLASWTASLPARGFTLAPATQVLERRNAGT